ncbi:MAG: hypothetical protein K6E29_02065 [Cyanobacteria bacterium RUI128]|nr:hypothetical protein [Cyanobacteria bacterium RUI128]
MFSGGVNQSANNIFKSSDSITSRTRSASGGASESEMRSLSKKDIADVTGISKDDLAYEFTKGMEDTSDKFEDEEWDRLADLFS